ncbi:hypothetical protein M8C21_016520, partial [Ambrosia artemisiifolia]
MSVAKEEYSHISRQNHLKLSEQEQFDMDKWRNMKPNNYVSSSRRKGRTSCTPVIDDPLITCPEPCRSSLDKRRAPTYKAMIYQSLSSIDDPNGTDVNTMANFLESKYFLPYKFKRSLAATVRRLLHTGKLEKVNNRYKLKGLSSDAETSQEEDVGNVDNENEAPRESLQDAARVAAFQVAVAETKEY